MSEFGLYLAVGSLVTLADVAVFNLLARRDARLTRVKAHLVSTCIALCIGFSLHLSVVFRPDEALLGARLSRYIATVLFSGYVVQTAVILLVGPLYLEFVRHSLHATSRGFLPLLAHEKCAINLVKATAIGVGMFINFVSFKYFVYAGY
jgi:putative flippase GtrA